MPIIDLGDPGTILQPQHVDDKNVFLVIFDLLLKEYIKSLYHDSTFVLIDSAYFTNFRLPNNWPVLASNFFQASDIENFKDLIKLLRRNNVPVDIICYSKDVLSSTYSQYSIENYHNAFLTELSRLGCHIYESDTDHSKLVVTSQAVLSSSANLTGRGMDPEKQSNDGLLTLFGKIECVGCNHSINDHSADKKCKIENCSCKDKVQDKPNYWEKRENAENERKNSKPWGS